MFNVQLAYESGPLVLRKIAADLAQPALHRMSPKLIVFGHALHGRSQTPDSLIGLYHWYFDAALHERTREHRESRPSLLTALSSESPCKANTSKTGSD